MYRERDSKLEQSKKEIIQFNFTDHYTEAVNGRYDNDNLSDMINTEEYGSKPNIFTEMADNSRDQNTDTIVSIMSNEGLNRINRVDQLDKNHFNESKQINNVYIDFKESFSMKRVLNSKSSDGRLKENAREEREKYYFENEKIPSDSSNILLNISNLEPKEISDKDNDAKENKSNNKVLIEIKRKNKKVNNNLEVFLKIPENIESSAKLINCNEEENGSNNEKIKMTTPENGRAKKLSDISLLEEKTFPISNRKTETDNNKQISSNISKNERKSNLSTVRNITEEHPHKTMKTKEIRETYLDRYKNKKNISTLSDNENRDINLKNNLKNIKKNLKTNENSERLHSENNQSTIGENDTKYKKNSSVVNDDKKVLRIQPITKRHTQYKTNSSFPESDKSFSSIINILRTSYEESKSSANTFVLRFNIPKTNKKSSSVIKSQKDKIIDVNFDFAVFVDEITNYNNLFKNLNNKVKELEDKIKNYKLKEIYYIEEIEDLKYKTSLLLTELKKTGNFDKSQINIDTIDINNNKLMFETISNVVVNETQNKGDSLPLTKSYLFILKEIGIDSSVFFNRTKQQEIENDYCDKCEENNENHKCVDGKWNYRKIFFDYPKLKLLIIALANKYNSELSSRLKSEEKSLKVMMNGLKNLENLDNKVKILERKNNSMIKNDHNKSSISSIHSGMYYNEPKDEFILKEIY